jgi:isoaspartyl peptidase/L-asparaginase-like protein (Ntn-hydrolase superfamily)
MVEPVVISNWEHGVGAVSSGIEVLRRGGSALDAVETGIRSVEDDPAATSVGTGGTPNIEGVLELDASIMVGNTHRAGAVTGLTMTKNPISVARKVMELSPHVMLAGEGARRFARASGFPEYNPLTASARERWTTLRKKLSEAMEGKLPFEGYDEAIGYDSASEALSGGLRLLMKSGQIEYFGTVGTLCVDGKGMIVAGTSTSGLPLRLPGRVADSSVIGAGTYASEHGAASSTGIGEYVIKHSLTRMVCEKMGEGLDPTEACEMVLRNMLKSENVRHIIGLIALDRNGEAGGAYISQEKKRFTFQYQRLSDSKMTVVRPNPVSLK